MRTKIIYSLIILVCTLGLFATVVPVHATPPTVKTTITDNNNPCGSGTTIGRSDTIDPNVLVVYFIMQNKSSAAPTLANSAQNAGTMQWTQRGFWKLTNSTYTWYVSEWWTFSTRVNPGWLFSLPVAQCEYAVGEEITGATGFDNVVPQLPYETDNSGGSAATTGSVGISTSQSNDLLLGVSLFIQKTGGSCPAQPTVSSSFTVDSSSCPQGGAVPAGLLTAQSYSSPQRQNVILITDTWAVTGNSLVIGDAVTSNAAVVCQFNCSGIQGPSGTAPSLSLVNPLDPGNINYTTSGIALLVIFIFALGFYARRHYQKRGGIFADIPKKGGLFSEPNNHKKGRVR